MVGAAAATPSPAAPAIRSGVARLQLLSEAASAEPRAGTGGQRLRSSPTAHAAALRGDRATAAPPQCYSFGPFADAARGAAAAHAPAARWRLRIARDTPAAAARGWRRAAAAAAASRRAAQAIAQRIAAAGFNDCFVVRDGAEANTIALGRYA